MTWRADQSSDAEATSVEPQSEESFARLPPGQHGLAQELVGADQRARLHAAMIHCVAEAGFGATTVEDALRRARVSRRTFYDYYENKGDCLLAACEEILAHWLRQGAALYEAQNPGARDAAGRLRAGVEALIECVLSDPSGARAIFVELRNFDAGLRRHSEAVQSLQRLLTALFTGPHGEPQLPDWMVEVLVGGSVEMITTRLRHGQLEQLRELARPLQGWLWCYRSASAARKINAAIQAAGSAEAALADAGDLDGGAGRASALWRDSAARPVQSRDFRARIIEAVNELVYEEGYEALSVGKITARARMSHHTFRKYFKDREEAFLAAYQDGHERVMRFSFKAATSSSDWRYQIRNGMQAWLRFFTLYPKLAQVGFVEVFAAGPRAVALRDQHLQLVTAGLNQGFEHTQGAPPHRVVAELVSGGIFNVTRAFVHGHRPQDLPLLAPVLTYGCLTPFLGQAAAAKVATSES